MKFFVNVVMPNGKFNAAVRDGSVGSKIHAILESIKPESAYFSEFDGRRNLMLIVDLADSSKLPTVAEPFFLTFDAEVHFKPVMSPEDLGRAGLDTIAKTWG